MKSKHIIATLLTLVLVFSVAPASLASVPSGTLYETTKDGGTPVQSQASSNSKQSHTLAKGKLVTIIETKINSAGNLWGKTVNDTWIYMGNLKKSNKALSSTGEYTTNSSDVPLRYTPASGGTIQKYLKKGVTIKITKTYYNHAGNPWGTTSDGYEVYMGNLTKKTTHVHTAVACNPFAVKYYSKDDIYHIKTVQNDEFCSCGALVSSSVKTYQEKHDYCNETTDECLVCGHIRIHKSLTTLYFVTAKDNVPTWSKPTSNSTKLNEIQKKGTQVEIKGRLVNRYGNHWGITTNNEYVFMGNLVYDLEKQLAISSAEIFYMVRETSAKLAAVNFFNNVKVAAFGT